MNEQWPSRACLLKLMYPVLSSNSLIPSRSQKRPWRPHTPTLSDLFYKGVNRGCTWFGVWRRQQQLSELGVFNILDPAEVQEPQSRQWG